MPDVDPNVSPYLTRPKRDEATAGRAFEAMRKVTCMVCRRPMTEGDHWECRHDSAKLRAYEEIMEGER